MGTLRLLILLGGLLFLAPTAADAKITLYNDGNGKVHITNKETTGSEAPQAQPPLGHSQVLPNFQEHQPAPPSPPTPRGNEPPEESEPPSPDKRGRQIASHAENAVNLINASAGPTRPSTPAVKAVIKSNPKPLTRAVRARRLANVPLEGSIRISQDEKGVLVITNLPEKEPNLTEVLAEHRRAAPRVPDTPVAWDETPLAGQIIRAAHRPKPAVSHAVVLEEGPIRRQHDKKGVIRISNVVVSHRKYSSPAVAALPPRLESVPAPPLALAQPPPLKPGDQLRTVAVRRDPKGRLHITTKEPNPPLLAGLPPPPALERIDPALAPIITEAATTYRLPPSLILSVIRMESNFVSWAVSSKGAMGLMQLMPGTAAELGVQEPFCPRQNIMGGSRYLRYLLNCFEGSLPLAVAAYNAGPHRVAAAGNQVPEIKETKEFVSSVLGLYSQLEKLSPVRQP
jgi:hypothetical protein